MAEPKKDHSIQARFGFADEDLKTSLHDEIITWCYRYSAEVYTLVLRRDALVKIGIPRLGLWLKNSKGYEVGAVDLVILTNGNESLFIEAKGTIRTLGELVRQINLYRGTDLYSYGKVHWLVVSPDDRFATILKEQNIHFLKYEPKRTFAEVGQ